MISFLPDKFHPIF